MIRWVMGAAIMLGVALLTCGCTFDAKLGLEVQVHAEAIDEISPIHDTAGSPPTP